MKKMLAILLLITAIIVGKDTTDIHLKDTLVTRSVEDNTNFFNINFWQTVISVLAGSILTLFGVWLSNKHQKKIADQQIKNQLLVAQANINVDTKRRFIEELLTETKNISTHINKLFKDVMYFRIYASIYSKLSVDKGIYQDKYYDRFMDTSKNNSDTNTDEIRKVFDRMETDVEYSRNRKTELFEVIINSVHQLKNITKSINLLFHKSSKYYIETKTILTKIENSFFDYSQIYSFATENFTDLEERKNELSEILQNNLNKLIALSQEIIDTERDFIEKILSSANT